MLIDTFTIPYKHITIPAYYRFTNIVCKYGGSAHEAYIPAHSNSCQMVAGFWEIVDISRWALADDPLLTPLTKKQEKYIPSNIKTRNCVERSFGVFKSRFRQVLTTVKTKNTYTS